MADRADIIRRIQALQAKTLANGCTEAEALAAASLAGKLLVEHGLAMTDIQIQERKDCERGDIKTGRKRSHEIQYCVMAIGVFCDCKAWKSGGNYSFFGFPEDVQTAIWLYNMIFASMGHELARYKATYPTGDKGRSKRQSHAFLLGMANRVAQRLRAMKREQDVQTQASTGRALVVVKGAVVASEFAKTGMRLGKSGGQTSSRDYNAYSAGQRAGDRVGFNRPVSHGGAIRMIGN
jgi:hypothetical protein